MDTQDYEEMPMNPQMMFNSPMHTYSGQILQLTNPENLLKELELTFKNVRIDHEGKEEQLGKPLMNSQGINSVLGQAKSIINQVTIMSNLEKTHISNVMEIFSETLARDLMTNRLSYEFPDTSARNKVYFSTLNSVFICLRRSFNGDDKRFWKGSQQESTMRIENNAGKKGLFSKVMGWGGN